MGATAAAVGSRLGAIFGGGSNPAAKEAEGFNPQQGYPEDAGPGDAAAGGEAGRIAPLAAAVASGKPEESAQPYKVRAIWHLHSQWSVD